jgi:hypothetical protein
MGLYLFHPVILDGFSDGAVAVQDGVLAVGTGSRSGGGAEVDFGNEEAYLHRWRSFRSRNVFWAESILLLSAFIVSSHRLRNSYPCSGWIFVGLTQRLDLLP